MLSHDCKLGFQLHTLFNIVIFNKTTTWNMRIYCTIRYNFFSYRYNIWLTEATCNRLIRFSTYDRILFAAGSITSSRLF